MKYIVKWESKVTGATGNGQPTEHSIAQSWVEHGNTLYGPNIYHWKEQVNE